MSQAAAKRKERPERRKPPVYTVTAEPGLDDKKGDEILVRFLREVASG